MLLPLQKQFKHMQNGVEILVLSSFRKTQALIFTSCLYFLKKSLYYLKFTSFVCYLCKYCKGQWWNKVCNSGSHKAGKPMQTVLQAILILLSVCSSPSGYGKKFRLLTLCSRSPSKPEKGNVWSFFMNASSEFQNKCKGSPLHCSIICCFPNYRHFLEPCWH